MLDLCRAEGLSATDIPADIAGVTARIPARNVEILTYPRPADPMQARFSLEYCAAVAALTGAVMPADFTAAAVARPEVHAWLPNVTLETHPIHDRSSDLAHREPDQVTIHLAGGGERRIDVSHPRGTPERPLSAAEMAQKFRSCTHGILSPEAARTAETAFYEFNNISNINKLTRLFHV